MSDDHHSEDHVDIREAVAKLCAQFPGEYWRKLDREMAYPSDNGQKIWTSRAKYSDLMILLARTTSKYQVNLG